MASSEPDDPSMVWYFSFGPNMNKGFFSGREGTAVQPPSKSVAGSLIGHQLAFTMMGYEECEPRFANLVALSNNARQRSVSGIVRMNVHGIAHQIPRSELRKLDEREGFVANQEERAFERIQVVFRPSTSGGDADTWPVYTYVAHAKKEASPGKPSRRYLDLLATAARSSNLPMAYIQWLETHPAHGTTAMLMPRPNDKSMPPRCIQLEELQANRYQPSAGSSGSAWVVLGGQIFDLNAWSVARAPSVREPMLRYMALEQDATAFTMKLLARAYPSERYDPVTTRLSQLSPRQRAYLASWANFFVLNACPLVGVLEGSQWEELIRSTPQTPIQCAEVLTPRSLTTTSIEASPVMLGGQVRAHGPLSVDETPMSVIALGLAETLLSSDAAKPATATSSIATLWAQDQRMSAGGSKDLTARGICVE